MTTRRDETDIATVLAQEALDIPVAAEFVARIRTTNQSRPPGVHHLRVWTGPLLAAAAVVTVLCLSVLMLTHPWQRDSALAPNTPQAATATFSGGGISFRYPQSWTILQADVPLSLGRSLAYLSNQPLQQPCLRGSTGIACGPPLRALKPEGVLVMWTRVDKPTPDAFTRLAGKSSVINGHLAKVTTATADTTCQGIGGTATISSAFRITPSSGSYFVMSACVGAKNAAINESAIDRMLQTVRLS